MHRRNGREAKNGDNKVHLTGQDVYDAMSEAMRVTEGPGKPTSVANSFQYKPVAVILNRIIEERSHALS